MLFGGERVWGIKRNGVNEGFGGMGRMRDLEKGEGWGIWRNGENEGFGGMGRMGDLEAGENEGFGGRGEWGIARWA